MRSKQRDNDRIISLVVTQIPNAASASGFFSDGTPWTMTRSSTGTHEINFDHRLIPIGGAATLGQNARITLSFGAIAPGSIFVHSLLYDGTDINCTFDLRLSLLDTRT